MATNELRGFENIVKSLWTEDDMMRQLGYERVEGLSFWVRGDNNFWTRQAFGSGPQRVYNRPFTKSQQRTYAWEQRKLGWKRRSREVRRRISRAVDALLGVKDESYD